MPSHGKPIDRRTVLKTSGTVLAGSAIAGCTGGNGSSQDDGGEPTYNARVGDAFTELGIVPHEVALLDRMPAQTDDRMTGQITRVQGGARIITGMLSGNIDVYANIIGDVMTAQAAGNDFRIIYPKTMGTDYVIAAKGGISLEDFADSSQQLVFGTSTPGGVSHTLPIGVFMEEGVDPSKVSFVEIGSSSARTSALISGNADGVAIHQEQYQRLKSEGEDVELLAATYEYFPNYVTEALAVLGDDLENEAFDAWCQDYINAVAWASARAMEDFDWVYEWSQKLQAQPLDRENARSTWEFIVNDLEGWPVYEFPEDPFKNVKDLAVAAGNFEADAVNVDDMIEKKYFEAAKENR